MATSQVPAYIPFLTTFLGAGTAFALGLWKARKDRLDERYSAILAVQVSISRHIRSLDRILESEVFKDPGFASGDSLYGHLNFVADGEHPNIGSLSFLLENSDIRPELLLNLGSADASYWSFFLVMTDRNEVFKSLRQSMKDYTPQPNPDGSLSERFDVVADPLEMSQFRSITRIAVEALQHARMKNKDALRELRKAALVVFPKRHFLCHDEESPTMRR